MRTTKGPIEQLDTYLERLERRERAQRRKKLLSVGLILACMGAGFIAFRQTNETPQNSALQSISVQDEIAVPAVAITELAREEQTSGNPESVDPLQNTAQAPTSEAHLSRLPAMTIVLDGTKKVGEEIVYTIENFNPAYQLSLDFGNGIRRKARQINTYTYPLPGYFDMSLLLHVGDSVRILHTLNYRILPSDETMDAPANGRFVDIPITRSMDPTGSSGVEKPSPDDVLILDQASTTIREPMVMADQMPQFPGGYQALNTYINTHVRYPSDAPVGRKGQVVIQFVVNADGSLSDLLLIRGLGKEFDQEAIRLITQMPRWIPGKENGLRVPVYHKVIIPFRQAS